MNPEMLSAASQFIKGAAKITHKQEVTRMYRKSLKLCNSWAISRDIFNAEATKIRNSFDKYKDLSPDDAKVKYIMNSAYKTMETYTHPDPYIVPWMPGGSLFQRNPPLPLDVCFPDGIPSDVHVDPIHIDMSKATAEDLDDTVALVDSANKKYY